MAVSNNQNQYIRIVNENGEFEYYQNESDRIKFKNAVPFEEIIEKVEKILEEKYKLMYDKVISLGITEKDYEEGWEYYYSLVSKDVECKNYVDTYFKILDELTQFKNEVDCGKGSTYNYEVLKEYFPNIEDSIPNYVSKGYTQILESDSIKDSYNKAKEMCFFGETKDC